MKLIPLTKGQFALVDDEDFERLSAYRWHLDHGYAARCPPRRSPRLPKIRMHRDILGPPPPGLECDHWNLNKLDNQRSNLRYVTHRQNGCNAGLQKNNKTGFIGVCEFGCRWRARIVTFGIDIHLGVFALKEEAAHAYDAASRLHHGPYGRRNFPDPEIPSTPGLPLAC